MILQLLTQYAINFWNRDFFNAVERKDGAELLTEALRFVPLAAASLALAVFSVWARMTLQRKWREWHPAHCCRSKFAWNQPAPSQRCDNTQRPRRRNVLSPENLSPLKLSTEGRSSMGSTTDKIKGATNEAVGKAKQGVGEAVGSDRLQGEGIIQEVKGKGQRAVGDAKEATKDAVNKAAAAANKKL